MILWSNRPKRPKEIPHWSIVFAWRPTWCHTSFPNSQEMVLVWLDFVWRRNVGRPAAQNGGGIFSYYHTPRDLVSNPQEAKGGW